MNILEVKNIHKSFPIKKNLWGKVEKSIKALTDVSISIKKGKTVGIIGESGCGKSTLGKVILDLEKPDKGEVLYKGKNIYNLSKQEYRNYRLNVQAVFQNPQSSLNPRMKIWEIVTEGLKINRNLQKEELLNIARKLLNRVNLPEEFLFKHPHQLSGGQKQRVAIARAIALKPEVIVADEPTSALDVSVQAQIVNLFQDIQEEEGISYLFISHSLPVVESISDTVAVMYRGFIVEMGTSKEIFSSAAHPYTKLLINSIPGVKTTITVSFPDESTEEYRGCPFLNRCPYRKKECEEFDMEETKLTETHTVRCLLHL